MTKSSGFSRRGFMQKAGAMGASTMALSAASIARAKDANEKVKLVWIGVGGRGGSILDRTVQLCPDARIVAVCDLIEEKVRRGQRIAERDKPKGYIDFREMLEKEKPDGVVVATEVGNHAKIVVPVLEAGFHCFSEKPVDCTVEKVDAITRAARSAKGLYQIGTQRRYHPGYIDGMKTIHGGRLGPVTFMQGHWHWTWSVGGWVRDVEMSGGELVEQACHHMDVMSWAMKNQHPVKCVAMGYQQVHHPRGPKVQSEDHSAVAFVFANGVIFSYTHLFLLPPRFVDEKLWVFCEKAGVDLTTATQYGRDGRIRNVGESSAPQLAQAARDRIAELADRLKRGEHAVQQELVDTLNMAVNKKNWDMGTEEELVDFVANIKSGGKRTPNANIETGRISTLMSLMGRKAMYNAAKAKFEPRVVTWDDLGSTTDPPVA